MAHNALDFVGLNCEKLIGERLPNLLVDTNFATKQDALHPTHFLGYIARWEGFDEEIWKCYTSLKKQFQELEDYDIAVTQLSEDGQPAPLVGIRCGNEITVSGHWDEYCLRQVATVAQTLDSQSQTVFDLAVEFGSSQTAESSPETEPESEPAKGQKKASRKGQPDVVSRKPSLPSEARQFLHCIGEIKTPWAHNIVAMSKDTDLGGDFRRLLGQIAKYMLDEKRKYGFVTTYEQTIFLKQDLVGKEWALFVSHVFKHNVRSIDPKSGKWSFDLGGQPKVSVRLAMLTLVWLSRTKEHYFADNPSPSWVVLEGSLNLKNKGLFKTKTVPVYDALTALCEKLGSSYGKTDPNFPRGIQERKESSRVPSPSESQTSAAPIRQSQRSAAQAGDLPQAFKGLGIGPSTPRKALSQPQSQSPRSPVSAIRGLIGKSKKDPTPRAKKVSFATTET